MALTDQVIMPGSDYQAICNATRKLTGKTATLKSGEISTELQSVSTGGSITTETKTVALNMASGNQVINNTSGKYMTQVTVTKPSTLIPANIKNGVNIGGVTGTLTTIDLPFKLITTQTVDDGVLTFTDQSLFTTLVVKPQSDSTTVYLTGIVGSTTTDTACQTYDSKYSTLSTTALVVSYSSSTKLYTYTWNIAESQNDSLYESTLLVYGL